MATLRTSENPTLRQLEEEESAHFTYDADAGTWCLSGPFRGGAYDEAGPYWETEDTAADRFEDAERAALDHIVAAHGDHLSVPLAAALTGRSERTIRHLIATGELAATETVRGYRIERAALEAAPVRPRGRPPTTPTERAGEGDDA